MRKINLRYNSIHKLEIRLSSFQAFYDENHRFVNIKNTVWKNNLKKIELTNSHQPPVSVCNVIFMNIIKSPSRTYLERCSEEMNANVFFYSEMNPHAGMLINIRENLYNYYNMVGPIKLSWHQILLKDNQLSDLLCNSYHSINHSNDINSLFSIISIIEQLETKKQVSCCKYKELVIGNIIQFKVNKLSKEELIILEILSLYAYYKYELT